MRKHHIGNIVVIVFALLYPLLWLTTLNGINPSDYSPELLAEILAGTAMILMAMGIFLSLRPRWFEGLFGGLDKMYMTHRRLATTAFGFLIIHFLINVDLPPDQPGTIMGTLAFIGIVVSVSLALAPRTPVLRNILHLGYNHWHNTHRFIGIFFIMGLIHYIWVVPKSLQSIPGYYMASFAVAGSLAYIYKQLLARLFEPRFPYMVAESKSLNRSIIELVLRPQNNKLQHNAGQFQFIQFPSESKLKEKHPFTISSSPREKNLRLTIKASGDWTNHMQQHIKTGMKAQVSGPYGRFNYKKGGQEQIWIAGGIGVTPFLSWLRDLDQQLDRQILFVYLCRERDDAIFWTEFEQAAQAHPSFSSHLQLSSQDGRLSPAQIATISGGRIEYKEFYLCGPGAMIEGFSKGFQDLGLHARQIHYEEFKFR